MSRVQLCRLSGKLFFFPCRSSRINTYTHTHTHTHTHTPFHQYHFFFLSEMQLWCVEAKRPYSEHEDGSHKAKMMRKLKTTWDSQIFPSIPKQLITSLFLVISKLLQHNIPCIICASWGTLSWWSLFLLAHVMFLSQGIKKKISEYFLINTESGKRALAWGNFAAETFLILVWDWEESWIMLGTWLAGYSPGGHKELGTAEWLTLSLTALFSLKRCI